MMNNVHFFNHKVHPNYPAPKNSTKMALVNGAAAGAGAGAKWSTPELLDAQTHIWNQMYSFINSMCLKCAIKLGVADAIHKHGKPMTLAELAAAIPINPAKSRGLFRVLRVLVHSKFFARVGTAEEDAAYALTPASRLLLSDEPLSLAYLALTMLDPVMMDPYQHFSEWLQNDLPTPFVTRNGVTPWEYAGRDGVWNELYNEGMACDCKFVSSLLVRECRHVFEGLRTMVDVGGGTGMVAKAIADGVPGLKCIVMDLPHVVGGLEDSENLSYVSGDMMDSIPPADAILLKWVINIWKHEDAVKLMSKCREALMKNNGGKVIIVEIVVDNQREDHEATKTQFLFDIMMMTRQAGGERTEKEWAQLFSDAGFKDYKITPTLGLRSVIEVFP